MITKLTILGQVYEIVVEEMPDEFGEHDPGTNVIRIGNNLTEEEIRSTILHEAIHACLFQSGITWTLKRKQEESIVRAIEHGLYRSGLIKERFTDESTP